MNETKVSHWPKAVVVQLVRCRVRSSGRAAAPLAVRPWQAVSMLAGWLVAVPRCPGSRGPHKLLDRKETLVPQVVWPTPLRLPGPGAQETGFQR